MSTLSRIKSLSFGHLRINFLKLMKNVNIQVNIFDFYVQLHHGPFYFWSKLKPLKRINLELKSTEKLKKIINFTMEAKKENK